MLYRIAIFSKYRDTSIYRYVSHITTTDIGYTSKKLSKMAGNSASYSPNSWWIDRL